MIKDSFNNSFGGQRNPLALGAFGKMSFIIPIKLILPSLPEYENSLFAAQ